MEATRRKQGRLRRDEGKQSRKKKGIERKTARKRKQERWGKVTKKAKGIKESVDRTFLWTKTKKA